VFAVLGVLQGLAPTAAILASGLLISAMPQALRDGPGSAGAAHSLLGLGLFGAALLAGAVIGAVLDVQMHLLNGRYGRTVHQIVAHATLYAPGVAALDDPHVTGELAALDNFDRADAFLVTATSLRELLRRRSSGIGAFVVLAVFAWWAPLVMLAAWRGLSVGVRRWLAHGIELDSSVAATGLRRSRYLRDLAVEAGAAKEIRVFGLAQWLTRGYADSYRAALNAIWSGRRLGMRTVLLATSGVLAAHVAVLGAIGWGAATGTVTLAQLSVYGQAVLASGALGYMFGVELPLTRARQVAWQVLTLERTLLGAAGPRPAPRPDAARPDGAPLDVVLRDVWFTYPGGRAPTLRGLDLRIPAGQSVAVVGENGTGKSTLVKILCGLYEPDSGVVETNGVSPSAQSGGIAAIFQNFARFELSLRENVGFGCLAAMEDDDRLRRALADAGAGDLAQRLPHGWQTVLSARYPGGQDLSGGQWQKVALARALAAVGGGAGLLILDEPTASLDVRAEAELFERFSAATEGATTTIVITHRLASVRHVDRIVVIAGGQVVEDGSHDELIAAGGRYATMFALQAQRFAAPALIGSKDGAPDG
jgi:ATP-binding cassette subfamily B protein